MYLCQLCRFETPLDDVALRRGEDGCICLACYGRETAPFAALSAAGVWILVFLALRYASVASMVAALSLALFALLFGASWPVLAFTTGAALAIIVLHRTNVRRLLAGEESRMELRRPRGNSFGTPAARLGSKRV
jgi:hypothetical protein